MIQLEAYLNTKVQLKDEAKLVFPSFEVENLTRKIRAYMKLKPLKNCIQYKKFQTLDKKVMPKNISTQNSEKLNQIGFNCPSLQFLSMVLKALSHGAIFLATFNAVLPLGDVTLANTSFHHSSLIYIKSRIALQVARKIAPCDRAFIVQWYYH